MGDLREYLSTLGQVDQLSGQFANSAEGLRKRIQLKQMQEELPEMLEKRDLGGIAARGLGAGIEKPLDYASQALAKNMYPTRVQTGVTAQQLVDAGFQKENAESIAGAPADKQSTLITATQRNTAEERQLKETQRRERQEKQSQVNKFSQDFAKIEKGIVEDEQAFKNVKAAIDQGTLPADAVVFNFLARKVAGEKGPLSDGDVRRFISSAFDNNVQKFENFVSGGTSSVLTDDQKKAYKQLLKSSSDNFANFKKERYEDIIARGLVDNPRLIDEKGNIDKSILTRAKQKGVTIEGGVVKSSITRKDVGDGDDAEIFEMANKLPEADKQKALAALEQYKGNNTAKLKIKANIQTALKSLEQKKGMTGGGQ